jgi:hypothetical protein
MGSTITAPQTVPQHVVDVEIVNRRHRGSSASHRPAGLLAELGLRPKPAKTRIVS